MTILLYCLVFVLGACWGSFLNCLIYRWEQGQKINRGRSFCPKCHHQLGFWDLVPIVSFIFLRRKCRYCRKKIAWQYLAVEIATGLLFIIIFNLQFSIYNEFSIIQFSKLIYLWIVACLLEIIFIYDLKHYIIPDRAVFSAIGLVFIFRILNLFENWNLKIENLPAFSNALLAGLVAASFFFIIWLASRGRAMGFGDVKLAFLLGLLLGWPLILVGLGIAFLSGALVGGGLMILGRKKMQSQAPFGPFLIGGALIALFFGERIINWYLSLMI